MSELFKNKLRAKIRSMASSPRVQLKRLALGTVISLVAMILLIITSQYESRILFYTLSLTAIIGIIYALPGYLGIWVWRMKDSLFRSFTLKDHHKNDSDN